MIGSLVDIAVAMGSIVGSEVSLFINTEYYQYRTLFYHIF